MVMTVHVDIVSAEKLIFSGLVDMLIVTGELGEMGIMPGHSPLITKLKPGQVRLVKPQGHAGSEEEIYYISGGVLEVQPRRVTVLADTVVRADHLDEAEAIKLREQALRKMRERSTEIDYAHAASELAEAAAQLQTIQKLRKQAKR
ncbi:MAG: F0F1 ATP synthase subunit epsilon [Gammaproteobacteria bacterium]|nr:F0F1 ATP synthase subunit epsilon [Gammaproteobacteria bacterium]